jgi:thiamine biosynthesis protein ThiS
MSNLLWESQVLQLVINGEQKKIDGIKTVQDLLLKLGYETDSIAVARDNTFVSRSTYSQCELKDGEELEILLPMQGG